jgi:hypothetical protein
MVTPLHTVTLTSLVVVRASEGAPGAPMDKKGELAVCAYPSMSPFKSIIIINVLETLIVLPPT